MSNYLQIMYFILKILLTLFRVKLKAKYATVNVFVLGNIFGKTSFLETRNSNFWMLSNKRRKNGLEFLQNIFVIVVQPYRLLCARGVKEFFILKRSGYLAQGQISGSYCKWPSRAPCEYFLEEDTMRTRLEDPMTCHQYIDQVIKLPTSGFCISSSMDQYMSDTSLCPQNVSS